jgi:putative tricarboxylic transport membrane protein
VRRADQVGGLLVLVFGIWYTAVALRYYPYWAPTGPGSGFLPFWLGVAMTVLAAMLLVQAARATGPGAAWLPEPGARRRLGLIFGVTTLFVALLTVVGMLLGTVMFLITVLRGIERYRWPTAVGIALAVAGFNYLVFTYWLHVQFPVSPLGF